MSPLIYFVSRGFVQKRDEVEEKKKTKVSQVSSGRIVQFKSDLSSVSHLSATFFLSAAKFKVGDVKSGC